MTQNHDDELKPIAEGLAFSGALDKAVNSHNAKLQADPEWSTKKWTHVHTLVTAFAHGVLTADRWHKKYTIPPGLESVLNFIAFKTQEEFKDTQVVQLSLCDIEKRFWAWGNEHPQFRKWNEPVDPGTVIGIVTATTPIQEGRDFIDLGALVRNASVFIRDERRANDAFDVEFKKRHPEYGK